MQSKLALLMAFSLGGIASAQDSCGPSAEEGCFRVQSTPGCTDPECCRSVCAADSFCCEVEWDIICRRGALDSCTPVAPANDQFGAAQPVVAGLFEVCTIGSRARPDMPLPRDCGGMLGDQIRHDVWFRYTATAAGEVTVDSCPDPLLGITSEFDPLIVVRELSGLSVACNDDAPGCGLYARASWTAVAGRTYAMQIGTHDDLTGYGTYRLSIVPSAPPCPADLNRDGQIGAIDITMMLSAWGTPAGDATGDGFTDAQDITALLGGWGACPQ
jgi:hypothetical protein